MSEFLFGSLDPNLTHDNSQKAICDFILLNKIELKFIKNSGYQMG